MSRSDQLAEDRTRLANQRTFLAFIRTALMVFATGITLIKLFYSDPWLVVLGWVLLPVSLFTFIMGVVLSIRMNKGLKLTADESV
ncbi:DUF202 domain-containing protein [Mangrovibacterium lignilyticum]|uniref:DUF202 domain-containing protein n=1 Tax=Mangrovibacterium lignilyticum TaxID=2668052 RepID=UPI0013D699A7|nr:DUF202 domain-containing protein [Mangrovibacterium lignilyticum]